MFDLEQSIANWRRQMHSAGIKTPVPLEELETHLREDFAEQKKSGLSEPMAFAASVLRIGQADALNAEFMKCSAKARRDQLLTRLVLGYSFLAYGAIKLMGIRAFLKTEMSPAWRLTGWADIALFALIVVSLLSWRWSRRAFPVIPSQRIRRAVGVGFGLLGAAGVVTLSNCILPNSEFPQGGGLVVVLWFFTLMLALAVTLAGLEDAAKSKTRDLKYV